MLAAYTSAHADKLSAISNLSAPNQQPISNLSAPNQQSANAAISNQQSLVYENSKNIL